MKKLVILGAGTGGTIMANLLRKRLRRADWAITIIDRDNEHYYQPGLLFIPFGFYTKKDIVKPRSKFLPRGVEFIVAEVDRINPAANEVMFQDGSSLPYDFLIVATGADIVPSETPGMLDGWRDTIFDFYTPDGAAALAEKLKNFPGGTIVVHINETPIKCPVAPLEFAFFCDWRLVRHDKRDKIELVYVTPLPGAFTKPVASKALAGLLEEKRVRMVTDFSAERIDAAARKLVGYDGREVPYDLLVTVPTNMGSEMIERSGMGNEFHYLPTDPNTLRSKKYENIFGIGDATDLPSSKAGSVAHSSPRSWPRTSSGRSRASRSSRPSTATPTASSRPASARLSSSTSTTRSSRCPGASRSRSSARCRSSSPAASTTGESSPSAGSTGTCSCGDGRSRSSRPG